MQSKSRTVEDYLQAQPPERREVLEKVRNEILANLPEGYEEGIQYGMIGYYVPHSLYPKGYHCDPKEPLPFAGLAALKNHFSLQMLCIYTDPKIRASFVEAYEKAGKKPDMGKGCLRFKKWNDLPEGLIGKTIASIPVEAFVANYESLIPENRNKKR